MATILVVDDTAVDRFLAGELLEEVPGWRAAYAEDGRQALSLLKESVPDLVLTDLQMPEVNGLELVEAIRRDHPAVPVILMTAHGSEEIAATALRKGAASYVPKRNLARDLAPTVTSVLEAAQAGRDQQMVLQWLEVAEYRFVLGNDLSHVRALVASLQSQMAQMEAIDRNGLIKVGIALHEVLTNAVEHGNLEVSSDLRELPDPRVYWDLTERRRGEAPYRDRRVHLTARLSRREVVFVVRDEGPGYDVSRLPDPTDPANLAKSSGRGLLLVRTFMDDVGFNAAGNEITLTKRCR
ncbi:MAG TPA: response regulator [Gemmataceae bacterium]|nr:response regulator [Gemmataceae bacterium]